MEVVMMDMVVMRVVMRGGGERGGSGEVMRVVMVMEVVMIAVVVMEKVMIGVVVMRVVMRKEVVMRMEVVVMKVW